MEENNYKFEFLSSLKPEIAYNELLDVRGWWSGLFDEHFIGESNQVGDVFDYAAGGGVHATTQELVELIPNKKIVWLVTKAHLNFLEDPEEWVGTKIQFEISPENNGSKISFTHIGLTPNIECYNQCTDAWGMYMKRLAERMR